MAKKPLLVQGLKWKSFSHKTLKLYHLSMALWSLFGRSALEPLAGDKEGQPYENVEKSHEEHNPQQAFQKQLGPCTGVRFSVGPFPSRPVLFWLGQPLLPLLNQCCIKIETFVYISLPLPKLQNQTPADSGLQDKSYPSPSLVSILCSASFSRKSQQFD